MTPDSKDPGRVEEIAGKLSAAQRRAVLHNNENGSPRYGWKGSGSASRALERKGLLRERSDSIGNVMWSLTPLGLAVRAHLKDSSHDQS